MGNEGRISEYALSNGEWAWAGRVHHTPLQNPAVVTPVSMRGLWARAARSCVMGYEQAWITNHRGRRETPQRRGTKTLSKFVHARNAVLSFPTVIFGGCCCLLNQKVGSTLYNVHTLHGVMQMKCIAVVAASPCSHGRYCTYVPSACLRPYSVFAQRGGWDWEGGFFAAGT